MNTSAQINLGLFAALLVAVSTASLAQSNAPAAQAQKGLSSEPESMSTTASYGDWQLRCQQTGSGAKAVRSCEIVQSILEKNQNAPVAQVAVGRPAPKEPLQITLVTPVNVSFSQTVAVAIDDKDQNPMRLGWTRCLPSGCFAAGPVKDEQFKQWRASTQQGKITFVNALSQDIAMPISFKGLDRALEALKAEPSF